MTAVLRTADPEPGARRSGGGTDMTFRQAMIAIEGAQKPGHGVPAYTRWINRWLARPFASAAYVRGLTPNTVTAWSGITSSAGLGVLLFADGEGAVTGVAVTLLLALGYVLDSADGQLARLQGSGGPAGEWLDHVVDAVRTPAIHLAVLFALIMSHSATWVLVIPALFCLMAVGHFMSQILAEQLSRGYSRDIAEPAGHSVRRSFLLLPVDHGALCWVFVLWGYPALFLLGYGLLALAQSIIGAPSLIRKYRSLRYLQTNLGGTP